MVLSTKTSGGQYLSRTWAADRADAAENPDDYTPAELTALEVPTGLVPTSAFEAETTPIDPDGISHTYDIRNPTYRPEVGR